MSHTIFIDGAVGTTGLEIADRLSDRPEFELLRLPEHQRKNVDARREAINDSDFVILCLPDDAAREAVSLISNDRTRVIDASTAHRVHPDWVFGFAEFKEGQKQRIAQAQFVSNPGCYSTGSIALLAPLVANGVLPKDWPYTINAVSGYSGGGKALIERFETETDIAFRSYGLTLAHKHMPEIKLHAGLTHDVILSPAVVPAYRGMLVEIPLNLGAMGCDARADRILVALQDHYRNSPIVHVKDGQGMEELLLKTNNQPSECLDLIVFANESGDQVRLIARLDNLGKGAAGSTVQDLNIMAGLDETAGLRL